MDIYRTIVLSQIPRALSLGDRNAASKTFGCFDRYYWQYLTDFSNSRFQEAVLLLALAYKHDFKGNWFYGKHKVLEWCKAGINFWIKLQHRNGSFNEMYPYENSFVATCFTTYAISEALLILNDQSLIRKCFIPLQKAGDWIADNNNLLVSNQMAGAIIALHNIFLLTQKAKYKEGIDKKIDLLLNLQHSEGYFPEYRGWDIGYLSICISYLAKYYQKTKERRIFGPLQKAIKFVENKVDAYCRYDYASTSRRTQYLYPHGFRILGSKIIRIHIGGLKENKVLNPVWMDDRYFLPLTIDYLQTYLEAKNAYDYK